MGLFSGISKTMGYAINPIGAATSKTASAMGVKGSSLELLDLASGYGLRSMFEQQDIDITLPDVNIDVPAAPTSRKTDTGAIVAVGASAANERISGKRSTGLGGLSTSRSGLKI